VEQSERQRIDKWLFFARILKSRTLAGKFVSGGNVRVNREKIDQPSAQIKPGDVLTISLERADPGAQNPWLWPSPWPGT
jgi:ribosome-associated heat shock protein Hsp15